MSLESLFLIIKNLLILFIVIVLVNLVLRYVNGFMTKKNKIIKIVERLSTSRDSSICVVMISKKYYLMSFTKEGHSILKDLDKEEVDQILMDKSEEENQRPKYNLDYLMDLKDKTKNYFEMRKKVE